MGSPPTTRAADALAFRPTVRPVACLASLALAALSVTGIATTARAAETVRIGLGTRIAAAPLHIASSRGYFERESLEVVFTSAEDDGELVELLADEDIDLATLSADAVLAASADGLDLRGAYVLGLSGAADAIVAREEVSDTRLLRGRRVAVLPRSPGALLLAEALQRKGRRITDVEAVALGGLEAAEALLAGDVDAAALHGPILSAFASTEGFSVLASAAEAEAEGLVSDLLVGTEDELEERKTATKGVIRALDRAVGWMRRNPEETIQLLAEIYSADAADTARALEGTELLDVEDGMMLLRGEYQKAFSRMSEVLDEAGAERRREVPSANRYLALSALRQVAAGR